VPLIQRKAFIGQPGDPKSAKRAAFGVPGSKARGGISATVEYQHAELGDGERNVRSIVEDHKSRYFGSVKELYAYAAESTETIGYVDREKTWVRLPERFLVLGERHSGTTLTDLVEATGTKRYIYEGGSSERPSPYLHPGEAAEGAGRHALEEILPKLVIGLIGVDQVLQAELAALRRSPGWKARIRQQAQAAELADLEADKRLYAQKLSEWSSTWETEHEDPETRKSVNVASPKAGRYQDELNPPPPDRPYSRETAEVSIAQKALVELRSAAYEDDDRITAFYNENRQVIDKTIAQLKSGLPVRFSRMFLKMATGKFDLSGLIRLLSAASEKEFSALRVEDVSRSKRYERHYETAPAGHRMEELRDSYMLHRILAAKAVGDRLAGLGDNHRKNLEKVLKQLDPEILVKQSTEFYKDQYKDHPDRS
jgi:hypothetical protein